MLALWLALVAPAHAIGTHLSHQGRLLDATGIPLQGTVSVTFSLYNDSTGGSLLWQESLSVAFDNGYYAVDLGKDAVNHPLDDSVFQTARLWLEVDPGTPLPRVEVASVPYARVAGTATNVSGGVVDASEIRINGTTVIDDGGALVGPGDGDTLADLDCAAGQAAVYYGTAWDCGDVAADWGDLGSVPSDLTDGDDDVLGALVCTDGQTAVWDGAGTRWTCGDVEGGASDTYTDDDAVGALEDADLYVRNTGDALTGGLTVDTLTASGTVTAHDLDAIGAVSADTVVASASLSGGSLSLTYDAVVGGDLDATNAVLSGDVDAVNALLSGDLEAANALLSGNLTAVDAALSGEVSAASAVLSGDLQAVDAVLSGDVTAVDAVLSGGVSAASALLSGDLEATDAVLSGDLTAVDAALSGALSAASAVLSGNVTAVDAVLSGDVTAVGAVLSGGLSAASASLSGDLEAADAVLSGNLTAVDAALSGEVSAASAILAGDLTAVDAVLSGNVTAVDAVLSGDVTAVDAVLSGAVTAASVSATSVSATTVSATSVSTTNLDVTGTFSADALASDSSVTANAEFPTIRLDHPTSGGISGLLFRSRVNLGSDAGFLVFQDESAQSPGTASEDVRLTLGVYNDFRQATAHSDELWLQGGGRLVQNVGSWDSELNAIIGTPAVGTTGGYEWRVDNTAVMSLSDGGTLDVNGTIQANAFELADGTDLGALWTLAAQEMFQRGATGWNDNTVSSCGQSYMLGGYGVRAGGCLTKTFSGLPSHTHIRVALEYQFIDSWDNERAYVQVDGTDVWSMNHPWMSVSGPSVCGGGSWGEGLDFPVEVERTHTASSVVISACSQLDEGSTNESFGISDLRIYVR